MRLNIRKEESEKMNKYVVMSWQRKSHILYKKRFKILPRLIQFAIRIICGCSIPPSVIIGEGTRFAHNGLGCIIHDECIIGRETVIQGNVVLGGKNGEKGPLIGTYCYIGAGACVLGEIKIGDDAMIGANAVVLHDVEPGAVVVGVPAQKVKMVDKKLIGRMKQ